MKLTRRGKRVRAIVILAGIILAGYGAQFVATHHRVYGNCHITADGRVCDLLRWEKN